MGYHCQSFPSESINCGLVSTVVSEHSMMFYRTNPQVRLCSILDNVYFFSYQDKIIKSGK